MSQADKEYLMQMEDRQRVISTLESKLKWTKDNYDDATEGDDHSMGAYHNHEDEYYEENPELDLVPMRM
jgi:hypothetical protein